MLASLSHVIYLELYIHIMYDSKSNVIIIVIYKPYMHGEQVYFVYIRPETVVRGSLRCDIARTEAEGNIKPQSSNYRGTGL